MLVSRRRELDAALLLDSTNGLYAIIGILSALNSLIILTFGEKWEVWDFDQSSYNPRTITPYSSIITSIIGALYPITRLKGQRLWYYKLPAWCPRIPGVFPTSIMPSEPTVEAICICYTLLVPFWDSSPVMRSAPLAANWRTRD